MHDVIVVGAGPGGSAAAIDLARRGLNILLLDRADFPRDKTCGDALTPHAIAILDSLGLLERFTRFPRVTQAVVVAPNGASETVRVPGTPSGPNYLQIVPRLIFDDMLREHAVACGACFSSPVHVHSVEAQDTHVEVSGERGGQPVSFQARFAIIATGASSGLLVRMGILKRLPSLGLAVRAYFEAVADLVPDQIQFRFDGVPLPGYAWIFPTSPTSANIGLGFFAVDFARRRLLHPPAPRAAFQRWLQSPALRGHLGEARQSGPIKGYPIRTDFLHAPTYGRRVLLVGEAAGLVNPLTGDGIDFALATGQIAARHFTTACAGGDISRQALAAYDRELRQRYSAHFRFCLGLRNLAMMNAQVLNQFLRISRKRPLLQDWLAKRLLDPP